MLIVAIVDRTLLEGDRLYLIAESLARDFSLFPSTESEELLPGLMTTLNCALLTVSDTRTAADDTSGDLLAGFISTDGHTLAARAIVPDDIYQIRAQVSQWIADPDIVVVITTGGTGFTGRDSTPEALGPLFDKTIDGFGELFVDLL